MPDPGVGIAVIGIGAVFPGAATADAFWANVVDGVDAIGPVPPERIDPVFFAGSAGTDPASGDPSDGDLASGRFTCRRGGFVDPAIVGVEPTRFGIMPVAAEGAEPDQLLALHVAAAALADAGDPHERTASERIGVIVGRGGYLTPGIGRLEQRVHAAQQLVESLRELLPHLGDDELDAIRADFDARLGPDRPEASIGLVPNLAASRIANRLDLQGPAYTIDAACASSLIAVDQAAHELRSGRCDLVLAGGVHHCHGLTLWRVFTQLGALSRAEQIRPFSRDADGILIGEGTGLFVLKRLADAERDGDRIYAVLRGTGVASDGRDASLMSPRVEGQVLALERAWQATGLDPATVGLVEAHGTATAAGDAAELDSLRRVFGKADDGRPTAGLGSVKSMIGHAMPAAGAAGLAKAVLAVHHGVLPPTLHAEDPNPLVGETRFRLVHRAEPWEQDGPRRAGVNAFGFGGINSHVVVEEHGAPTRRRAAPAAARTDRAPVVVPTLLLAGATPAEVAAQLDALDPGSLTDLRPPTAAPEGPVRLAIVGPDLKRLDLARKVVERGQAWRGRNDLWFSADGLLAAGGKLAYLFPGVEPTFDPRIDDVVEHFGLDPLDIPEGAGRLETQGRGIVAVGRALDAALAVLGVAPDLVAGHSLGEWSGEIATEMIPREAVDAFIDGLRPGHLEVPDVAFLALGCGADTATELAAAFDGVTVSHDNCPHQSVLCGPETAIRELLAELPARRILGQELPFRSGFHSPAFAPYLPGIRAHLERLPLQAPRVPLWSATTVAPYPDDPDAVRQLVLDHLVAPVRFRELVERLYDTEGVRAFVQVGVGSLTGFVDDTLKGRDVLTVAANSAKSSGLDQLARVAAALWVEGSDVRFPALAPTDGVASRGAATPPPTNGASPSSPFPLRLGTPLVRGLRPLRLPAAPAGDQGRPHPVGPPPSGDPLLDHLDALLAEAAEAGLAVHEQWAAAAATRSPATVAPTPAVPATPATLATRAHPGAPAEPAAPAFAGLEERREFSLAVEPRWVDHAFYRQADGWPSEADRFPLVPMTGMIQLFVETAERCRPGSVVVALEDVRATKWLAVEPPVEVTLRATPDAEPDRLRVSLDGHSRARVVVADGYPEAPPPRLTDTTPGLDETGPVVGPEFYDDRWMFHGPAYQGVRTFTGFGRGGVRGTVEALAAPGALLDAAGQMIGYWVSATETVDQLVLPTSIERIELFGPHPEPGTLVDVTVAVLEMTGRTVRCDIELAHAGRVWCRCLGWVDRRFDTDGDVFSLLRHPEGRTLSFPLPDGPTITVERWPDTASRDMMMRRYLGTAEREVYERRNPRAQRQWLLGRIAAKDALRSAWWDAGHGPIFPAELELDNDESGRPVLVRRPVGTDDRTVSIAHTEWLGAALVGPAGVGVGVDIEVVEARDGRFESLTLTAAEQALAPPAGDDRDRWLTRLWAAKEAVAKAMGTGLQGRPKAFAATAIADDRLLVAGHWVRTAVVDPDALVRAHLDPTLIGARAATRSDEPKEYVVAWTEFPH